MSSSKPPMVAIGMVDEVWTVAIADQFGWVKAGTGDPLDDSTVAGWTQLVPETEWGVDRGAVFSTHTNEEEARSVFERCEANGVRVSLLRRSVGPWEEQS